MQIIGERIYFNGCSVETERANRLFNTIYPRYITSFYGKWEYDFPGGLRDFLADEMNRRKVESVGSYKSFFYLVEDYFPFYEKKLKRRRFLKKEHSQDDWNAKLKEYNYRCAYCNTTGSNLEKDHVIPVSRGGSDKIENIVPCCLPCNRRKSAMNKDDFIKKLISVSSFQ